MFGVIATSLLEAARTTGFARVPHNEDWRLVEARQREVAASERDATASSQARPPAPSYSQPHGSSRP